MRTIKLLICFILICYTGCDRQKKSMVSEQTGQQQQEERTKSDQEIFTEVSKSRECKLIKITNAEDDHSLNCRFEVDGITIVVIGVGRSPKVSVWGESRNYAVSTKIDPACIGIMRSTTQVKRIDWETNEANYVTPFMFISPIDGEAYNNGDFCIELHEKWLKNGGYYDVF